MNPSSSSAFGLYYYRCLRALCVLSTLFLLSLQTVAQNSVVIAVEDDAAPWSRADGSGYANDLVISAFKAVGIDVELKVVPYARCKRMVVNGEVAGCFSMSPAPDFAGIVELSGKPLFVVQSGYFYNLQKPPAAKRPEDLPPKTIVGTVLGYEYPNSFEQLKQKGVIVVDESPSEEINLRKLAAGRIDLALLTYNEMKTPQMLIQKAGVSGKVKTTFLAGSENSYIGFSTRHQQGAWARAQFNKGFALILRNGTLRRLQTNWLRILNKK